MDKQELLTKLIELQGIDDDESGHSQADKLLIAYINDPDITKAFEEIHKWYA